jgi:hypothetical protein
LCCYNITISLAAVREGGFILEVDPRIAKTLSSTSPPPLRAETLSTFRTASGSAGAPGAARRCPLSRRGD